MQKRKKGLQRQGKMGLRHFRQKKKKNIWFLLVLRIGTYDSVEIVIFRFIAFPLKSLLVHLLTKGLQLREMGRKD